MERGKEDTVEEKLLLKVEILQNTRKKRREWKKRITNHVGRWRKRK